MTSHLFVVLRGRNTSDVRISHRLQKLVFGPLIRHAESTWDPWRRGMLRSSCRQRDGAVRRPSGLWVVSPDAASHYLYN